MKKPKKLSSDIAYKTEYFQIISDELEWDDGVVRNYSYAHAYDGVCIAAVNENDEVYLLEEFKYPVGGMVTTLPAGGIKDGEAGFEAAKRELREEAGLQAKQWKELGLFYPMAATATFKGTCFLAQDLRKVEMKHDETERIAIKKVSFSQAIEMATNGEIVDGWAMITLFLAEKYLHSEG